jgi:class 3 adenylate cyclase
MARYFRKLRLFLASPNDIGPQRDRVNRIAERLNRLGGPAEEAGVILEVIRWETHIAPLTGRPQSVILDQIPSDEWDIFVGILWLRFGVSPGLETKDAREEFKSGTEEEFNLAYELWRKTGRPQILFYRCMQPPDTMDLLEVEQWGRVVEFFKRFEANGSHPGLYSTFQDWDLFEQKLEADLTRLLSTIKENASDQQWPLENIASPKIHTTDNPLDGKLDPGEAYQAAFLSIDIADHNILVRKHRNNSDKVQQLINSFRLLVREEAARHEGEIFSWAGDGGTLIFWGDGHQSRAILAGLHMLREVALIHLDETKNPLLEPIHVRLAANEALIVFQLPTTAISSEDLNLAVHLQEKFTSPGEFCITDTLLGGASQNLSSFFIFKGRFEGKPIYYYSEPNPEAKPTAKLLSDLVAAAAQGVSNISRILELEAELSSDLLANLSAALDDFYSLLQRFCSWFAQIDERWAIEYLKQILSAATNLLEGEATVWDALRKRYLTRDIADEPEFEAAVQAYSTRRSQPVVYLEKLKASLARRTTGQPSPQRKILVSQTMARVRTLIKADELDQETALTDLLLNYKDLLADLLVERDGWEERNALIDHLWRLADLVLQDELYSLHDHRRQNERNLTVLLSETPLSDVRFSILRSLLQQPEVSSQKLIEDKFRILSEPESDCQLEIAWRCLAIGHPNAATKRFAADQLSLASVLQLIARNRLPMKLLYDLGLRFKRSESEELQKIFCDCIRGKVLEEIGRANNRAAVADLTKIVVLLLEFGFMVETIYFERFDELISYFLESVKRVGLKIDYFERIRTQLGTMREERGTPKGEVPRRIRELPPSIQRRLAGEAPYLLWFIGHPDQRIALETMRHINLNNIESVLRLPELNGMLMREILKKTEFFARASVVSLALSHPKCSTEFAAPHLRTMSRSSQGNGALKLLSQNAAANPAIRAMAKKLCTAE